MAPLRPFKSEVLEVKVFQSTFNCVRNFFGKAGSLGVDTYPAILTTVV